MVDLFNASSEIGILLTNATNNVTGDMTLTLVSLMVIVVALFMAFRLPAELSLIMALPLIIVLMAFNATFVVVGGSILIVAGVLFAYNFFIK